MQNGKNIRELRRKIKELEEKNETLKLYAEVLRENLIKELNKGHKEMYITRCPNTI